MLASALQSGRTNGRRPKGKSNFDRRSKTKLLSLLALLLCAVTQGAWAQTGILNGVFSVSETKKVSFAQGNLTRADGKWAFLTNSWEYNTSAAANDKLDTADGAEHFQWGTVFKAANSGESEVVDDITTDLGTDWRGLSQAEWRYLMGYDGNNSGEQSPKRSVDWHRYAKVTGAAVGTGNKRYVLIFPDKFTESDWTDDMGDKPTAFDGTDESSFAYTAANFTAMQTAGIVILPAAGYKYKGSWYNVGSYSDTWLTTSYNSSNAYMIQFFGDAMRTGTLAKGNYLPVRLVKEIQEIATNTDWENFCTAVNGGNTYKDKIVKMTANVSGVTTMVGTNETNSFQGTFDGLGHTLNVNITDNSAAPAPFKHIKNATICNLVVTGSVSSTVNHVAGLVQTPYGTITIENCNVAATISGAQYMGGFIGHSQSAAVTINGCVFSGTLEPTGSNYAGGFIGWGNGVTGNTMAVTNSLFCGTLAGSATSKFHPIGFNYVPANPTRVFTNTYYTIAAKNINEDTEARSFVKGLDANSKGKLVYSITAGADVTSLAFSSEATATYNVSGITVYAKGIKYDGVYYAGNGDAVSLTLSHADKTGYTFNQYTATGGGTLSAQTETSATLTMIDADQTISATWTKNELALSEAADNATAISEAAVSGKTYAVTLTRTLQQGGWNTFCVPFDLATPTGWTVKALTASEFNSGTGELTLTFADAASIEAGKPYLVKVTSTVANPTFEGVTITDGTTTTETASADFVPVMNPTSLTGGDKTVLFVTGGNKLTFPTADGNINGLRAYFQLKGEAVAEARAFRMSFDDDATGIVTVLTDEPTTASGIYTLDGRRIEGQPAGKGVYIVNGKKTIIK